MEHEILLACNIGDLPWLKASLEGFKKGINEIYNNEVRPRCIDNTKLVYSTTLQGLTPLHLAAYTRNIPILKYLISKELDIDSSTLYTANTPLHLVLLNSSCSVDNEGQAIRDCMQLLLSQGAQCNK